MLHKNNPFYNVVRTSKDADREWLKASVCGRTMLSSDI
jgi:hypothetical protein